MGRPAREVVSLSFAHPDVPVAERAELLGGTARAADALRAAAGHVDEALLLVTCLRVELVATADDPDRVWAAFAAVSHRPLPPAGAVRSGSDALYHLIRVAAGLDSAVLGEPEVLGQVRAALRSAREAGTSGPVLERTIQGVLAAARRVRRVVGPVSSGSLASLAAAQVEAAFPAGGRVAVVGSGAMADAALTRLDGRYELVRFGRRGGLEPIASLPAALPVVDAIISATGARRPLFDLETLIAGRGAEPRPLHILDLAVPPDFPAGTGSLPGVRYVGVDVLAAGTPSPAHDALDGLAREEATCLAARLAAPRPAGTVQQLEAAGRRAAEEELARALARLPGLHPEQQAEVARLAHRLAGRLMHGPLAALRRGRLDEQLARDVFSLGSAPADDAKPARGRRGEPKAP